MGFWPDIGSNDSILKPLILQKCFNLLCRPAVEPGVHMDRSDIIMNGYPGYTFAEYPKQCEAVFSSGKPYDDSISIGDHVVSMQGFAESFVQRFVYAV